MIDWSKCPDAERTPGKLSGAWCIKGHRIRCEDITGQFEAGCSAEEIAGPEIYDLPLDLVRRVLRFARLAEAASLLQQAETIMHRLWEEESDRSDLPPDKIEMLEQTAIEIEQAAGTLAQVTYQPDDDEAADDLA